MKHTTASQKSTVPQDSVHNTSTTFGKRMHSTGTRKRKVEISSGRTTLKARSQDTLSDISSDEAENTIPLKQRRVSIIHTYAEKLSDVEYKCLLCMAHFLSKSVPGYDGPHANTVRRTMRNLFADKILELREELKQIPYVCLTTDLWRRPKKHHYLCVTVHYLNLNYVHISKVLSFRRFHGRHFGQRIQNHLIRVVNKFQLKSKIVATVIDNGGDIRLATQYPEVFGVRLHCLAHGLNLVVQKGLQLWRKKEKTQAVTSDLTRSQNDNETDDTDSCEVEEELSDESDEEEENTSTIFNVGSDESDAAAKYLYLDEEDDCEAPRDDTEIVSSDEDMDDDDQIPDYSTLINNINDILSNCRKIINTINRSNILYGIVYNLARPSLNVDLILDMRIRWNSTYKMTSRLLEYRSVLTEFMNKLSSMEGVTPKQKKKFIKYQLSDVEWDILDTLNSVLSFFSEASSMLSGRNYTTFSIAYDVFESLLHYLEAPTINGIEKSIKHMLKETFYKYVYHPNDSSERNILLVCAFLDPIVYDLMDEQDKLSAKKVLMMEASAKRGVNQDNTTVSASSISIITNPGATTTSSTIKVSPMEQVKLFRAKCGVVEPSRIPTKSRTLSLKQEIAKFESLDKDDHSFSSFWRKYEKFLPLLGNMARRYGPIPASSVASESSFSIAGYLARKNRSSLSAKNLKYSMFLRDKI